MTFFILTFLCIGFHSGGCVVCQRCQRTATPLATGWRSVQCREGVKMFETGGCLHPSGARKLHSIVLHYKDYSLWQTCRAISFGSRRGPVTLCGCSFSSLSPPSFFLMEKSTCTFSQLKTENMRLHVLGRVC